MGPIESINQMFRKGTTFTGRATRSEFWWPQFFYIVLLIGLVFIENTVMGGDFIEDDYGILSFPFELILWIPMLTLSVRRYHDIGATGIFPIAFSIMSIPLYLPWLNDFPIGSLADNLDTVYLLFITVCLFVFLFFATRNSAPTNKYGPNPLEVSS